MGETCQGWDANGKEKRQKGGHDYEVRRVFVIDIRKNIARKGNLEESRVNTTRLSWAHVRRGGRREEREERSHLPRRQPAPRH